MLLKVLPLNIIQEIYVDVVLFLKTTHHACNKLVIHTGTQPFTMHMQVHRNTHTFLTKNSVNQGQAGANKTLSSGWILNIKNQNMATHPPYPAILAISLTKNLLIYQVCTKRL